jgi:hypothetical protein
VIDVLRSDGNPWGEVLAVALVLGPALLAAWGMARVYRRRRATEEAAYGDLPTTREPDREPDGEALYTGTTRRGPCRYWFDPAGALVFQRYRGPVVCIAMVRELGLVGAHAGRVLSPERIAVVGWTLGGHDVDTGFAFPEAVEARAFAETLAGVVGLPVDRGPSAGAEA